MGEPARLLMTFALVCSSVAAASAQPKKSPPKPPAPPPLAVVGATPAIKLTAEAGFLDEVVAFENGRVAYLIADASTKAELHIVPVNCPKCVEDKQEVVV